MLAVIIDNRINNLKTEDLASHAQTKMSSIFTGQKMADTSKSGCYLAEEYATLQLHKRK